MLLKWQKPQFFNSSVCANGMSLLNNSAKKSLKYLVQVSSNDWLSS